MDNRVARPIFVVGSPRSGTSILTWALGQHPNILPTEEAPARGPVAVGVHYAIGSGRGARSQLSALGMDRDEFHAAFGEAIDRLVRGYRTELERRSEIAARDDPALVSDGFAISRGAHEPKQRWVDGTPESSFYICGLNRLFPEAKFVHILRDVREVAASMLGFRGDDGSPLAQSAEEACDYWLRVTQACDLALRALGPEKVYRLRYADLLANTETALRGVLGFLGEPWTPACLEPLARCINSSHVENADVFATAAATPKIVEALALSDRLCATPPPASIDAAARAEFEARFERAVEHARNVDGYHEAAKAILVGIGDALNERGDMKQFPRRVAEMRKALAHWRHLATVCAIALAVQWCAALAVWMSTQATAAAIAFGIATTACLAYLWLRRAGLHAIVRRRFGLESNEESR